MTIPGAVGIHFILSFIQSSSNPFLRMTIFLPFSLSICIGPHTFIDDSMLFKKKGNPEKYVSVLKLTKLIFGESLTMVVYRVSKVFFTALYIKLFCVSRAFY